MSIPSGASRTKDGQKPGTASGASRARNVPPFRLRPRREVSGTVGGVVAVSKSDQPGAASRPTNGDNSVNASTAGNPAADEDGFPDPSDVAAEFRAKYGDRADLPLTREDGRTLRAELVEGSEKYIQQNGGIGELPDEMVEEWESEPAVPWESSVSGVEVVERTPLTWQAAVEHLLDSHEDTLNTVLNFEKAEPGHPEHATWSKESTDRWMPEYQKRYFAQDKAWLRELTGGERPSGGETEATFENPSVVLFSRSASSVPDGERLAPTDHDAALGEAWEPAYHTLRNKLRAEGLELGEDWQYVRREEPHTSKRGGGANACYGHEHVILVVDGEVSPSTFRPVVEKHVEECEYAGATAHDLDVADWDEAPSAEECECDTGCEECVGTVVVKDPDELHDVAKYVADYCSIEPMDLLERSAEYVGWAAVKHATNTRTFSRSDAANWAATADACRQRAESDESEQEVGHGENIVRSDRRGVRLECEACGSPHDIDQSQTLVRARMDASEGGQESAATVADGGGVDERENRLRQRWPDAKAAASVGETSEEREQRRAIESYLEGHPDADTATVLGAVGLPPDDAQLVEEIRAGVDHTEVVGFERPPEWRLDTVEVHGEEFLAGTGGGVDMATVESRSYPPHGGGRECRSCGEEAVVSARESEAVYRREVESAAYLCTQCGQKFAPVGAPVSPFDRTDSPPER